MTEDEINNLLPYQAAEILERFISARIPIGAREAVDYWKFEKALRAKANSVYEPPK